ASTHRTAPARARTRRHCASSPAWGDGLRAHQLVLEPAPHGGAAEREVVALAVLRAAFLAGEDPQRLVLRSAGIVERLRVSERDRLAALAMHPKERAAHLLYAAVELERLKSLQCVRERTGAEDPHDVVARHRERGFELRLDASLPYGVIIPDRAPGDAAAKRG